MSTPAPWGPPLPLQATAQGEAERGEEEEALHGGGAGLGGALQVWAAQRRGSYTNRYTLAPRY